MGSSDFRALPNPATPLVISPNAEVDFTVEFSPTAVGLQSATIRISSNDPTAPAVDLPVSGTAGAANITTVLADQGDYGDVCRGTFRDLALTISNSGSCPLAVSGISSTSAEFQVGQVMVYPLLLAPGTATQIPLRLQPFHARGEVRHGVRLQQRSGYPSQIAHRVRQHAAGGHSGERVDGLWRRVCGDAGGEDRRDLNVGKCNLNVTSASIDCADFTIINNPVPAPVSLDFCLGLTIRFTPTSAGPKQCTLTIVSDDPETPVVTRTLTRNTPLPMIDVPPDLPFPPEVIQATGACTTAEAFPVSNAGQCDLRITDFAITTNPAEYALDGLPSFPIILEPGHEAGEGDLSVVFGPEVLDRDRLGQVSVTYVSEPILNQTTTVTRDLCGEGVNTGARVLVTENGVPVASVEKIQIQRITGNRMKKRILQSVGVVQDVALQTVTPAAPCPAFQFHYEWSTVGNPIQLLTGSYQLTATIKSAVTGHRETKTVGFALGTCDFNANITIEF